MSGIVAFSSFSYEPRLRDLEDDILARIENLGARR